MHNIYTRMYTYTHAYREFVLVHGGLCGRFCPWVFIRSPEYIRLQQKVSIIESDENFSSLSISGFICTIKNLKVWRHMLLTFVTDCDTFSNPSSRAWHTLLSAPLLTCSYLYPSIYDVHKEIKAFDSLPPRPTASTWDWPTPPLWKSTCRRNEVLISLLKHLLQWPFEPKLNFNYNMIVIYLKLYNH